MIRKMSALGAVEMELRIQLPSSALTRWAWGWPKVELAFELSEGIQPPNKGLAAS